MKQGALSDRSARLDTLFDALGDEHRLRVLVGLYSADPDAQFATADFVEPGDAPEPVRTSLHHVHFPKLDELELVEWDREADAVSRGPEFSAVEQLFDRLVVGDDEMQSGSLGHEIRAHGTV